MNGYNFTERVRKVLALARQEAARLHHEYVGTEHILLGLVQEGEGVAVVVLQNLGVDPDGICSKIDEVVKRGNATQTTGPDLPYTSRAKKVLELSMSEARALNHAYVGTEHLLLGVLREERGIGAQVLKDAGVSLDAARSETLRILGEPALSHERTVPVRRRPNAEADVHPWLGMPERLRFVLATAHSVAGNLGATEVTPVHVAISLLEHDGGTASALLDLLPFKREPALQALNAVAARNTATSAPESAMKLSVEMVQVLRQADKEKRDLDAARPSTEHLLIALLECAPDVAAVFSEQNLTAEHIRDGVRRISG